MITNKGNIKYLTSESKWKQTQFKVPNAREIAIGGSSIWILAGKKIDGGYKIYKVDPFKGIIEPRYAYERTGKSLAVDSEGNPWIISAYKEIYKMDDGKW